MHTHHGSSGASGSERRGQEQCYTTRNGVFWRREVKPFLFLRQKTLMRSVSLCSGPLPSLKLCGGSCRPHPPLKLPYAERPPLLPTGQGEDAPSVSTKPRKDYRALNRAQAERPPPLPPGQGEDAPSAAGAERLRPLNAGQRRSERVHSRLCPSRSKGAHENGLFIAGDGNNHFRECTLLKKNYRVPHRSKSPTPSCIRIMALRGQAVASAEGRGCSSLRAMACCRAERSNLSYFRATKRQCASLRPLPALCPRCYYAGAHAARTPLSRPYAQSNAPRAERSSLSYSGSWRNALCVGRAVARRVLRGLMPPAPPSPPSRPPDWRGEVPPTTPNKKQ